MTATDLSMVHGYHVFSNHLFKMSSMDNIWRLYTSQGEWDSRPSCIQGNMASTNLVNQERHIT